MNKKVLISLLIVASFGLTLTACGSKKNEENTTASKSQSTSVDNPKNQTVEGYIKNVTFDSIDDQSEKFIAHFVYPQFGIATLDEQILLYAREVTSSFAIESESTEISTSGELEPSEEEDENAVDLPIVTGYFSLETAQDLFNFNDQYLSILLTTFEDIGADQLIMQQKTFVYDTKDKKILTVEDLFKKDTDAFKIIHQFVQNNILSLNPEIDSTVLSEILTDDPALYQNFVLNESGISFYFSTEMLNNTFDTPLMVDIPYSDIKDILIIQVPDELLVDHNASSSSVSATASDTPSVSTADQADQAEDSTLDEQTDQSSLDSLVPEE